jgi:hypothetical protein
VVVSAANSAARKRPRTPDVKPRAVEDQAVHAAPRPAGSGPKDPDERSEVRADADASLTAVNLDAEPDEVTDLDNDAGSRDSEADRDCGTLARKRVYGGDLARTGANRGERRSRKPNGSGESSATHRSSRPGTSIPER